MSSADRVIVLATICTLVIAPAVASVVLTLAAQRRRRPPRGRHRR